MLISIFYCICQYLCMPIYIYIVACIIYNINIKWVYIYICICDIPPSFNRMNMGICICVCPYILIHICESAVTLTMAFQVALVVKIRPADAEGLERRWFNLWVSKIPLEEEMATHSSILAWEIPWTEEPGRLQSLGLQRVRHD